MSEIEVTYRLYEENGKATWQYISGDIIGATATYTAARALITDALRGTDMRVIQYIELPLATTPGIWQRTPLHPGDGKSTLIHNGELVRHYQTAAEVRAFLDGVEDGLCHPGEN